MSKLEKAMKAKLPVFVSEFGTCDYSVRYNDFNRAKYWMDKYLDKYSIENDDDYRYYIRSILFYVFEQCFIGIKTEQEKWLNHILKAIWV